MSCPRILLTTIILLTLALLQPPQLRATTILKTVDGYDLSLEVPTGYSTPHLDWTNSPDKSIALGFVFVEDTLKSAMDAFSHYDTKQYLSSNIGFVEVQAKDGDRHARLLMAGGCQGHCVVKVAIFNDPTPRAEVEAEGLFERYKADLASRKFESANADVHDQSLPSSQASWLVIAGAWPDNQKIKDRVALLKNNGISAHVVNTDDYSNLTPGLKAVVLGPTSRDQAQALLDKVQSVVPDAFIKQGRN